VGCFHKEQVHRGVGVIGFGVGELKLNPIPNTKASQNSRATQVGV